MRLAPRLRPRLPRENSPPISPGDASPRRGRWWAPVAALAATALTVAACAGSSGGAKQGDHWHAAVTIRVCGESYVEPPSSGGIHTHGDGAIHVHPHESSEAGKNATLRRFFQGARVVVQDTKVQLPGGRAYANGDLCPSNRRGQLQFIVNGRPTAKGLDYQPQDGDKIEVIFE